MSTPFKGTLMASPKFLFESLDDKIVRRIKNQFLTDRTVDILRIVYNFIVSNSHMDYDIALPGGIPEEYISLYDPNLLQNIFSDSNIKSAHQLASYYNVCTGIDEKTMPLALKKADFLGIGLCILDELLYNEPSDGLVTVSSQRSIEQHYGENLNQLSIVSSYHDILSNPRATEELLFVVNDTLEQQEEVKTFQKSRRH